jgi:exonuclease SbcC
MIPVSLTICGIYSYIKEQTVDFRMLTSAHLFGIFGAVGSGKSALLEAIMYALYGESERLNSREQRSYNMMNLKSDTALIEFDFEAPANQGLFRAVARGKRNSKNKEDVKFERSFYKIDNELLVPIDIERIPSIVGLSHENFRRTIIIPQGKFQEFLQLPPKDRTDMVKELFGLQRFDLSINTGRLQKKNDEALNTCQGRLEQLGEITAEDISQKKNELQELTGEITRDEQQLAEKEKREKEIQQLSELFISLCKNRENLQQFEKLLPDIQSSEQRLNDYDECVNNFKSDLELLDEKRKEWRSGEEELLLKHEMLEKATVTNQVNEDRFENARIAYESRDRLKVMADGLRTCAAINTHVKEAESLAERIAKGEAQIKETSKDLESHKAQAKLLRGNQETLKTRLPELNKLKAASEWVAQLKLISEKCSNQEAMEASAKAILEGVEQELKKVLSANNLPDEAAGQPDKIPDLIKVRISAIEEELKTISERINQLELQEHLKSFVSGLEEGQPCPLCGSTEHPHMLETEEVLPELTSLRSIISAKEKELNNLREGFTKSGMLIRRHADTMLEIEKVLAVKNEIIKTRKHHLEINPWREITEEDLQTQWDIYYKVQQELDNLETQIKEALNKADEETLNLNKYTTLLGELKGKEVAARQMIINLKDQLGEITYEEYAGTTAEAILGQAEALELQYRLSEESYHSLDKILRSSRSELQTLTGAKQQKEESQLRLKHSLDDLSKQLEVRIMASKFKDENTIREILSIRMDRLKERERITLFRERMAALVSAIRDMETRLEGKSYNQEEHEKLKQEIAEFKLRLDQRKGLKGGLEETLNNLIKDLEESLRLKAVLKSLEVRRDNLKTLLDLFRGQGFVNYVSTMYLQNLVSSANERFYRLTRQHLKLELDPENNFRIRDYLNEGQWRNVKTLSGGQTFQASLCLALALADNIQQLNRGGQNFFFLDEGFGTLDRESLEMVFDTLKSLRKENRIVGVISHMEDLQQEISAWLNVSRDDEKGSLITPSWEGS